MHLYGRDWPTDKILTVELMCFRHGIMTEQGGLGKAGHFKKIVAILWPDDGRKHGFVWHPWAEEMLEAACNYQYVSVSGGRSSGKTQFFALWAIVNWLAAPLDTMVLVTSTSLKESRKRIWGAIEDLFRAATGMPGKLVSSIGTIRTYDSENRIYGSERSGIALIAGESKQEKQNIGKLIGIKNTRVFLIGDELPELSHALIEAATSNLSSNPEFQFIGIGNPNSRFDPHGALSEPVGGWKTIDETATRWKTRLGIAIRFDLTLSPNITLGKKIFAFLPTQEDIEKVIAELGPNSLNFWRMVKGFWCPEGTVTGCIYSEPEIVNSGSMTKLRDDEWMIPPLKIGVCDPSWASGGDECPAHILSFGTSKSGLQTLQVEVEELMKESDPKRERMPQIVDEFIALCRKHNAMPSNIVYDATGGGVTFGSFLCEKLGDSSPNGICLADSASETPCGPRSLPASEQYADRVSEVWFVGQDFLRSGQLRGITKGIAADMMARLEDPEKRGTSGGKRAVEPKRTMKKRIGRSPDKGDSFFMGLDHARSKLKFRAAVSRAANLHAAAQWNAFKNKAEAADREAVPTNLEDARMPVTAGARRGKWQPAELVEEKYGFDY